MIFTPATFNRRHRLARAGGGEHTRGVNLRWFDHFTPQSISHESASSGSVASPSTLLSHPEPVRARSVADRHNNL